MRVMFGFVVGCLLTAFGLPVLQSTAGLFSYGDKVTQRVCDPTNAYCVEQHTYAAIPVLPAELHEIEVRRQSDGRKVDSMVDPFGGRPVSIAWKDGNAIIDDGNGSALTIARALIERPSA